MCDWHLIYNITQKIFYEKALYVLNLNRLFNIFVIKTFHYKSFLCAFKTKLVNFSKRKATV